MDYRETEFAKLPNPKAYALFVLMAHREKKNGWQRLIQRARHRRQYKDYGREVLDRMVSKLKDNGLLESKELENGSTLPVPTKKGLRAITNRRVDYEVDWWTVGRDRVITRLMSLIALVVSIVALCVKIFC